MKSPIRRISFRLDNLIQQRKNKFKSSYVQESDNICNIIEQINQRLGIDVIDTEVQVIPTKHVHLKPKNPIWVWSK